MELARSFNISPEHTRVALISYAHEAHLKFGFHDYKDLLSLQRGLAAIKRDVNTASQVSFISVYQTALIAFYEERPGASKALVLLTYARNITQNNETKNVLNRMKGKGISISVVAMETKADLSSLVGLAGHEHNLQAGSMDSVPWLVDIICKGISLYVIAMQ